MTEYSPQNVLVTGGAGFIGSNLVHFLLRTDLGLRIVILDRLTYAGSIENLAGLAAPERYTFVHGDICDDALVNRLMNEHEIDTVVHLAAESHVDRSIADPADFLRTNVTGTFVLLEAARRAWASAAPESRRFHHVSTDEVYGTLGPNDRRFTEKTAYSPSSPYAASKAASDHLVCAYTRTYGLPVTLSNCSNNYGERQHSEKFVPTVILSCLKRRPIPLYGDGTNVRDWLYVGDHCRALDCILRRGRLGQKYNIGGENERSNIDLARTLCHLMDQEVPEGAPHADLIRPAADRPGHDWRYAIDITAIRRDLGWSPIQGFEQGLRRTIHWFLLRRNVSPGVDHDRLLCRTLSREFSR